MVRTAVRINRYPVRTGPGRAGQDAAEVRLSEDFEARAVGKAPVAVQEDHGVVQGLRLEVRKSVGGVCHPGVKGRIGRRRVGNGVVGSVVPDPDHPVGHRSIHLPAWRGDKPLCIPDLQRQGLLNDCPHPVVLREHQPQESLGSPIG